MADSSGRLQDAENAIILQALPGVDFLALYPGVIISQSGQLFDFQPDSPKLPGFKNLKFYSGSPGVEITVDPTQSPRAVLFFEGGSPAGAALAFFSFAGLSLLQLGVNATKGAARVGDPVSIALSDLTQFVWPGGPPTGGPVVAPQTKISAGSTQIQIA